MWKKYHNPPIRIGFPVEEHVTTILTSYAFELLQDEIELSTKYLAAKTVMTLTWCNIIANLMDVTSYVG